jgi:predicted secreted acid phosphatase
MINEKFGAIKRHKNAKGKKANDETFIENINYQIREKAKKKKLYETHTPEFVEFIPKLERKRIKGAFIFLKLINREVPK